MQIKPEDLRGCNRWLRKFQPQLIACDRGLRYLIFKEVAPVLSERIHQLRRKSGLSQEQLAEKIGVSRQAISKWESGASTPEFQKLLALSECFQITLDELVRDGDSAQGREAAAQREPEGPAAPKAAHKRAGIRLCLAGALCLTLTGIVTAINPSAAEQLNTSSTVTLNGSGVITVLCALLMAAGAVLILGKK